MNEHTPSARRKKQRGVLVKETREELNQSRETLDEIANSCCKPDRSVEMRAAQDSLDQFITILDGKEDFVAAQNALATFGAHIGRLNVTCCTPTRKKMYQKLLGHLNKSYLMLSRADGRGH